MRRNAFEALVTGTWHDRGETSVRPDHSGLVTFYDPSLSSLVNEARYGKDRLHFRLERISALDTEQVRDELRTALTRERDGGSGINWGSIVRVVTERYAARLEHLRFLLSSKCRAWIHSSELPLHAGSCSSCSRCISRQQTSQSGFPRRLTSSWATPVALRCAAADVAHSAWHARAAVENTLHEICRRLVRFFDVEAADEVGATGALQMARDHISELIP